MKKAYLIWYGLVFIIITGMSSCKNNSEETTEVSIPTKVKTAHVTKQEIKEHLTFNGVIKYQQREDIRANVTGYISWMPFKIGDKIKKGQAFATIRTKEQDALNDAVKIDSTLAKFTKPLQLVSNAGGILSNLKIVTNDYVSEGDVLATVSQPKTLVVQVSVPFEVSGKVKIGTPCTVIIKGHPEIEAQISSVLSSTDSIGQSQHYLIRLPDSNLPENLNVQVRIVSKKSDDNLTIPRRALQTNELLTSYWVFKVQGDSLALKKYVTPLLESDSLVQIASDEVRLNDKVIVQGGYQMQDSTRVSIEQE